jgi:hypothetical protein
MGQRGIEGKNRFRILMPVFHPMNVHQFLLLVALLAFSQKLLSQTTNDFPSLEATQNFETSGLIDTQLFIPSSLMALFVHEITTAHCSCLSP